MPQSESSNSSLNSFITVSVNGNEHSVAVGMTVVKLLNDLGFQNRAIAVERNFEILPQTEFETCELSDGDSLEIVSLVGGG